MSYSTPHVSSLRLLDICHTRDCTKLYKRDHACAVMDRKCRMTAMTASKALLLAEKPQTTSRKRCVK